MLLALHSENGNTSMFTVSNLPFLDCERILLRATFNKYNFNKTEN